MNLKSYLLKTRPHLLRPISLDNMRQPDPRNQNGGRVAPPEEVAPKRGFSLLESSAPCPIPGSENGVVFYDLPDGRRAIWDDGKVFVRDSND